MDYKTKILTMLAEGKITVSEAEKLLNAVDSKETTAKTELVNAAQQFFNIIVDSTKEKAARVKIKIPLRLLKAGMKFVHLIPEDSLKKIQLATEKKGINFDWTTLDKLGEDLLDTLKALEVDVDDKETGESVRIYCG